MTVIFWRDKMFLKTESPTQESYPAHFIQITLSVTVFEIEAFLCFAFLKKKILKFRMAAIFAK